VINILVLLGKTCAGKDSCVKELVDHMGYKMIVSYTTRPMRDGEVDGITYKFIDKEKFLTLKEKNFFAETTSYHVASGETWYYGMSMEDMSKADEKTVVILNPEGLRKVRKIKGLNIVAIYIDAKKSVIKKRLRKRGDNRKEAKRRIKADDIDFKNIENEIDYVVPNNQHNNIETQASLIDFIYTDEITWRKQYETYD